MLDNVPEGKQYNYRYVIGLLFAAVTFVNGMCWVVVSPISDRIQQAYQVSPMLVSLLPMLFMLLYVGLNFPSNWVLDGKGIKKGVVTGATLTFLGSGIRAMVKYNFFFLLVGQVVCAMAQPFILNAGMKIATRWFNKQNRPLALTLLSSANIIGIGVGFLIPPLFVSAKDNNVLIRDNFVTLLLFELALAGVASILTYVFFKESPPTLPSVAAMVENEQFDISVRRLFKSRAFLLFTFAVGSIVGNFYLYGSLLNDILSPYGEELVSLYLRVTMVLSGIIAAAFACIYVGRTRKCRTIMVICGVLGLLAAVAFPLCLWLDMESYWIFLFIVMVQGVVFVTIQPLSLDYACDFMFPVGEAQISGVLISAGQILGLLFILLSQNVFSLGKQGQTPESSKASSLHSTLLTNGFLALGCLLLFWQNSPQTRSNLEHRQPSLTSVDSLLYS